jgi:hypothetical protein
MSYYGLPYVTDEQARKVGLRSTSVGSIGNPERRAEL